MKNYCYICGKELSNDGSGNTVRSHKEHIIHNGIYGRLKFSTILCEQCGSAYSKSDAEFVDLFKGFIDLLSNELYSKDHGTEKKKKIRAYLNPNLEEQVEIEYYNGKTYPLNPYYIVDEEKEELTLYANQNRMKAYEKYILKENPEYATYSIRCKDNLTGDAQIGLFFSEQNPNFNQVFKSGLAKIATEFALHSGIKRNDIKTTLTINDDGTCSFHGCVFSLIYHRPLVMLRRKGQENAMFSRWENLIQLFELKPNNQNIDKRIFPLSINWNIVDSVMEHERKTSLEYLKSALNALK